MMYLRFLLYFLIATTTFYFVSRYVANQESSSFEFTMEKFKLNKNNIELNQKSIKLIKYLKGDINELFTGIKYNLTYNKEDLMKSVAKYKNKQIEEIDHSVEKCKDIK